MEQQKRLAGRLALVTGATRGIGRAVVRLAREGAHLILVGRTSGALEEVDDEIQALGGTATLLTLNLKHQDKIDALGPTIYQRWEKLDILVGNAGILGPLSPLGHVTADAWDDVLAINLTANWRLIRTLDPLLRRSDAGRAIFVSSGAASAARAYWGPYAAIQGRIGGAGRDLRARDGEHEGAGQPGEPRPDPNRHARQGLSG
jgi:NAD(P)-dependent dehydrogenase (short-subunit alcohol dehydrogenase family)